MHDHPDVRWWRTRSGLILCGFLFVTAFFLLTQHTAHVFGVLPYLLILACPLMHMFHHHGDAGHGGSEDRRGGGRGQAGDRP